MTPPDWLQFFQRTYPSANMVLIRGRQPVLVDTGFGSDLPTTQQYLREAGVPPEQLHLIVNTHYHCDHAGGNHGLQQQYHLPIATHRWEGQLINRRDREACCVEWLVQPVEPYQVDQFLREGDEIEAGGVTLQVLHTPGHTLGHIALYAPQDQVLICGDVFHGDDVAWLNIFREGVGALPRMMETLERLARLPLRWACSGHGPFITDPPAAIAAALHRYERWLVDPHKIAWHACKRIFTYALMLFDGLPKAEVGPYLLQCPWFQDYSRYLIEVEPEVFIKPFLTEMIRSGAAAWQEEQLIAQAPYTPPPPGWLSDLARPKMWGG